MNLNWSNRVIKYVLFIFNLLFVISGIIMIAVGVSVKEYYSDYDIFLNGSYFSLPNLLIAIGSLIFFISFFGCCGAVRESWFMTFVFSILLGIIFIMEFSAGIAGYVLRDNTASYLKDSLTNSMNKYEFYNADHPSGVTYMWDAIQNEFHCCGANGPNDWANINPTTTKKTPQTTSMDSTTGSAGPTSSVTSGATTTTTITTTTASTTPTTPTGTTANLPVSQQPQTSEGKRRRRDVGAQHDPNDLPFSCCVAKPGSTGTVTCSLNSTTATYSKKGCVTGFGDYLKEHAVTIGGVGIAIALIQLFGVIFACHLAKQLKHGFYST